MRYRRLADLVRLALRMQGRADGVSLQDIMDEFEVSRRTAERLRDAVREAFPQVEELGEPGGQKRWRLPPTSVGRMAEPTLDDIAALHRATELARQSGDAQTAAHLTDLGDRLRAAQTAAARRKLEPDIAALLEADGVALRPGPREILDPQVLASLREAILAGVWIEADHRARASGLLSRNVRLGPLAMLLGEGRQYLVAWSAWADDVRLFSLAGFERVDLVDDVFERPQGFDLRAYLQRSFGVYQEEVHDIEWRFSPEAASEARQFLFHPTQVLTDNADGSLTVQFRACGLQEMAWHLVRWGDQVEVVEPEELRMLI